MPEFVTEEVVERAKAHVIKRKGVEFVNEVMLERIDGGVRPYHEEEIVRQHSPTST